MMRAESLVTTEDALVDFFKTRLERHEEAQDLNSPTAQLSAFGSSVATAPNASGRTGRSWLFGGYCR